METERNRNKRRDKAQKKRTQGMRVDTGAKKLAEIKRNKLYLQVDLQRSDEGMGL